MSAGREVVGRVSPVIRGWGRGGPRLKNMIGALSKYIRATDGASGAVYVLPNLKPTLGTVRIYTHPKALFLFHPPLCAATAPYGSWPLLQTPSQSLALLKRFSSVSSGFMGLFLLFALVQSRLTRGSA